MAKKVRRAWSEKERGPGINAQGEMVVSGIQLGNIFITVQPLLGVEGDPMRLLFERDLTPHPQYCAAYEWMRLSKENGGVGTQAVSKSLFCSLFKYPSQFLTFDSFQTYAQR